MKALTKRELKDSIFLNVPKLAEILFPDDVLPFPIDKDLLHSLSLYNEQSQQWDYFSSNCKRKRIDSEKCFATFLNQICTSLCKAKAGEGVVPQSPSMCRRLWSANHCTRPIRGPGPKRKPDVILVDAISTLEPRSWGSVLSVGEITSKKFNASLRQTLISKAYLMFREQEDRRFVVNIALCGQSLHIGLFDRAGVCFSEGYDIHSCPQVLLRTVVGLLFASQSAFGFDPTITTSNGARQVTVIETYTIQKTLFRSNSLRGRATICWHAKKDGKDYVIKDTWADTARPQSEKRILDKLRDVEGVPRAKEEKIINLDGKLDSTDCRRTLSGRRPSGPAQKRFRCLENRVHVRLVLEPFAIPIWDFATKRELISVFIDIVRSTFTSFVLTSNVTLPISVHERLINDKQILHRDISLNNVMIYTPEPSETTTLPAAKEEGIRRGMIIDMDYALDENQEIGGEIVPLYTLDTEGLPVMFNGVAGQVTPGHRTVSS
jgi:hypothetical protein